jgi:peroxiredoxin family protein
MTPPLIIHLHSEGFERAYQALTLALTAQAMGQEVAVVLAFGALRALAEDRLGEPTPGPDLWCARRADMLGVSSAQKLLAEARALGVKLWACETVVKLSGVDEEQLEGKVEVTSLPLIVKRQQQGQVMYL